MANLEKHKHNLVHEYLEGEEGTQPAQPRSAHVTGGAVAKTARRRLRPHALHGQAARTEPALVREPAHPVRTAEKHSPASSPEHQRKLSRLSKLRAPRFPQGGPK